MTTYTAAVMAAPCPKCHQLARSRCVLPDGRQRGEPHAVRVPVVVVAAPSVCVQCEGGGVLMSHDAIRPCPACTCEVCYRPTDTPPDCNCATGEKS